MNDASLRKLTGVVLILTPVAFNVFFTLLSVIFGYPDICANPQATSCAVSPWAAARNRATGDGAS
jgi:hypothetical protein